MVITSRNVISGGVRDVISEHTIKGDVITGEIRRERTNMELIDKVLNGNNVVDATKKVLANKGACGVDGITIEKFKEDWKNNLINFEEIKERIKSRKYIPQPVLRARIPKENGTMRDLGIPVIMDRIIQQAIVQVLSPMYEEQFSDNSYGFRPGRSCEQAITKLLELFNDGYVWVVDIDLEKFFDNVCHDKLISLIMKTVHDGELVSLIRKYLKAGVMDKGVFQETTKGTPQGGNLSPLLSNIMLNELDKELDKRGLKYVRYADDTVIVVKSEKAANRVMSSIVKYIEKKLGLKVNATKTRIAKPNQIKYLGFGFYYTKGGKIKPKPHLKSIEKFKRKLKQLTERSWSISLDDRLTKINAVIRGWVNYFKITDMKSLMASIGEWLRHRLRTIIWKYWKIPMARYNALVKLGISKENAYEVANTSKGYFWVAKTVILHIAISNKRLEQRGLILPEKHYNKVHITI